MDEPLEETAEREPVLQRFHRQRQEEEAMLALLRKNIGYLDPERRVILLDFTEAKSRVRVIRNLAQLIDPQALAVLEVSPMFEREVKRPGLSFSMSLNISGQRLMGAAFDLGEIMRLLNIGSGHAGAASGRLDAPSKAAMLKGKAEILAQIGARFARQMTGEG